MLLISVLFFCSCFVFSLHPILSGFTALNWMSQQHPFLADIIIQTVSQIFTIRLPEPCFCAKNSFATLYQLHCASFSQSDQPELLKFACPIGQITDQVYPPGSPPSITMQATFYMYAGFMTVNQHFLTVTTLSDLGSFSGCTSIAPQYLEAWFFPFLPNLTCGIFGQTDLISRLSTLQHECTHPTYPHFVVYPIVVFDFHQLIRYPTLQGVGISPSVFLVASVECLIPVCLCIGEVSTQLRVLGISQPPAEAAGFRVLDISQPLLLPVPIHSQNFQNLAYTSNFTVLPSFVIPLLQTFRLNTVFFCGLYQSLVSP